ncbi:sensor histidine kinase [Nocardioides anomalus]|uniref:histidine kinase n=1 Tax=Nocardioides anomalus TaxID=2712223 RepID=A0A6G6W8S4_9ACTN|nr:sensor histidine kinase [Nocardioides anomalus]QIG41609.1 sensor histidine kinase [Nocardioides anomalus]
MNRRATVLLPTVGGLLVGGAAVAVELVADDGSFGHQVVPGGVWIYAVVGAALAVLTGALAATGRGRLALGCSVFAVSALTAALLRAHLHWSLTAPPTGSTAGLLAEIWVVKVTTLIPQLFVSFALVLYPDGRLPGGRWRRISVASVAYSVCSGIPQILGPGTLDPVPVVGTDPGNSVFEGRHVLVAPVVGAPLEWWMPVIALFAIVVALPLQLYVPFLRWCASTGAEREQLYWVLWAVVAVGLCALADTIIREGTLDAWLITLGTALFALAMAAGLLGTRVSGEAMLTHTVVYGGLWVLVLALDLAFLSVLTFALGDSLAQQDVILAVLFCSAVIYAPVRAALWRVVRRVLLGQRENPYDVVAGLAAGLEQADEGRDQLQAVARAVGRAFGVSYVAVEVERSGGSRTTATVGTPPQDVRRLPIAYRGRVVGRLVLPARGLRTRLNRRDEALLSDLIRQAAVAARTTQLADALQDNRERLVLTREEERRRLRRDLHDGLGPSLGGAVFQLDAARLAVDRDPEAAVRQLQATETHLLGVMDDVRRLVSDLRPPALDSLGLVAALRQQGELVAGLDVRVVAAPLGHLPAAVEVAAYRIAGEALTNVARHAQARRCTIRLAVEDGALLVEVADDGTGIAADREAGVGLLSLRERADELGGRVEITCPPTGGTVVRAWLPTSVVTPQPEELLA